MSPASGRTAGLALALALPAAALAIAQPPELVPAGRVALGLLAAAGALVFAWRPMTLDAGTARSVALFLPLFGASLIAAPNRARAVDETAQFGVLILIGLLGLQAARESRSFRLVPVLLAALASIASVQAIAQAHWLYPRQAELLRAGGDPAADNAILRLEAGRPAGPFLLPSSLAGYLALALPSTILLARRASRRRERALLVGATLLELYALALTRSLGGVAAAALGLLLLLPALTSRRRIAGGLIVALMAVVLAGWSLHQRRAEIDRGPGSDPLRLRMGNWRAAARMIGDHPLLGVGPGSYGTAYPRYLRQGMNETRYAHNSYLQAAACWGVWILGPVGALLLGFVIRIRDGLRKGGDDEAGPRLAVAAGAATFLAHNLFDFTLYQPGIAAPAALLLGMTLGVDGGLSEATAARRWGFRLAAAAGAALLAWNALVTGRIEARMEAARRAASAMDVPLARDAARRAAAARPGSAEPWAFLAQLALAHRSSEADLTQEDVEAADRAVRLDPESAILHHTRALYHAAAKEKAPAYLEELLAHRLYPLKAVYRLPEAEGSP